MTKALRILVVDQDPGYAAQACRRLTQAGYQVECRRAGPPEEVLAALDGFHPDLVFAAQAPQPGWNAVTVAGLVNGRPHGPPIVLVLDSPKGAGSSAPSAVPAGFADCVARDQPERLLEVVDRVYRRRAGFFRTLRARRAQQDHFWRALEQGPVSILAMAPDGTVEYVNRRFTEVSGYPAPEIVGHSAWMLLSDRTSEAVRAELTEAVVAGRVWRGELLLRKRSGETYWVDSITSPAVSDDGTVTRVVSVHEDITARKAQERERNAIVELSHAMGNASTLADLMAGVTEHAARLLAAHGGCMIRPGPGGAGRAHYRIEAARGCWGGVAEACLPGHLEPVAAVMEAGQAFVGDTPPFGHLGRSGGGSGTQSVLGVPLHARGDRFGSLWLVRNLDQPGATAFEPSEVELVTALAELGASALIRAALIEKTERGLQRLQAASAIDQAITASLDPALTLQMILSQVPRQLGVDASCVLLLDPVTLTLEYAAGTGFRTAGAEMFRTRLGAGTAGLASLERTLQGTGYDAVHHAAPIRADLLAREGFAAHYATPLVSKGKVIGVLEVFNRAPLEPDEEWKSYFRGLAEQTAIAIENGRLVRDLQRSNDELALAYDATIEGWVKALDLRDHETEGHTVRVTELAVRLARRLGLSEADLVQVRRGALLHDVGKMAIPDAILCKPGPLTAIERAMMEQHTTYAYEWLSPIAFLRPAVDIPYCHHERLDGTGYPRGLVADQIPFAARIFAAVDVYDALISDRVYRRAWSEERARDHLRSLAGTHLDPAVVKAFLDLQGLPSAGT